MKLTKKIYHSIFGLLFSLALLFVFPKGIYSVDLCSWSGAGCYSNSQCTRCDGGTCVGALLRREFKCITCPCGHPLCLASCYYPDPEYPEDGVCSCKCHFEDCYVTGACAYPEECFISECERWTGWHPCNSLGWQYRTCVVDPYAIDWRQCTPGPTASPEPTPAPTCTVDMPANQRISLGQNLGLRATITNQGGNITRVNFSSSGSAISSPNPTSDSTPTYDTTITGVSVGSGNVTANVIMGGSSRCSDSTTVTVIPPGPWWQVKDADVASGRKISSIIASTCILPACQNHFDLDEGGWLSWNTNNVFGNNLYFLQQEIHLNVILVYGGGLNI